MTKTLANLALVPFCLGLTLAACSGDVPKEKPKAPSAAVSMAKPSAALVAAKTDLEALTAVAPARPSSIADAPVPTAQKIPELEIVDQFEFSHSDPDVAEADELPDFDRALKADEVKVDRFVLATGVDKREPTGETDTFSSDTKRIFAFVQLENETAPYSFAVHFEKVDGPKSLYGVKLQVPTAERYRTWAWTQVHHTPGQYRAVLRTPAGEEIASRLFTIE